MKKKIPYGISNFASLIQDQCFYIDQTPYIERLENMGEKYLFFFRPRRFGKSLFLSLLNYYYGIQYKDKFENYFSGLYIGQHPTPLANQYAILNFNFSGIETGSREKTYQAFLASISISIKKFIEDYLPDLSQEDLQNIFHDKTPPLLLGSFFNACRHLKIYVLIDEYDHFTNGLLAADYDHFREVVTGEGYLRKFYEMLKNATWEGIVDRIFMTGVTPVTLDSLTSGFNIGRNISNTLAMHELMGFTQPQVEGLLTSFISPEEGYKIFLMGELKKWYNGYKFSEKANNLLYNPDMILYFLSEYHLQGEFPAKMLDTNIASDYGKMKNIFKIKNEAQNYEVLRDIVEEKPLYAMITQQFSFERDFERADFISLLYYMGYLTLRETNSSNVTRLAMPNYVIQKLYLDFMMDLLKQKEKIQVPTSELGNAMESMASEGNVEPFFQMIEEILEHLSNRDYQNFDEKYIKVIIMGIALMYPVYFIVSERESRNGYLDLLFLRQPPFTPRYQFAFELKYLKKAEEGQLKKTQEEAAGQLKKYMEASEQLKNQSDVIPYTIVVVKSKIYLERI